MKILFLASVVSLLLNKPQFSFVNGQVQETTTTAQYTILQQQQHKQQNHHIHHSHYNHNQKQKHHQQYQHQHHQQQQQHQQENEHRFSQSQGESINLSRSFGQQHATPHHTRHQHHHHQHHQQHQHQHHQQNTYHSNINRKHYGYSVTTKPSTISYNIELSKKSQQHYDEQTTTSLPVLNDNADNHSNNNKNNNNNKSKSTNNSHQYQYHRLQKYHNHHHHHHHYYDDEIQNPQHEELRVHQHQQNDQHHKHHQQQQHHKEHEHHQASLEAIVGTIGVRKTIKNDAVSERTENFGASLQHNHLDVQENENSDDDYYYYQDDDDDDASDRTSNDTDENYGDDKDKDKDNDDDDQLHYPQQQHNTVYDDHEYARVTRDHSHHFPDHNYQHQYDQDYVNDEPSPSSREQLSTFLNNTKPGVLTEQKFRELGTPESVQESRDKYLEQKRARSLANDHIRRMSIEASCSRPMPRVIYVSNETSKTYLPRATVLHRCGEDTGCCVSTSQVCTVKTYKDVELYFIVFNLSNEQNTSKLVLRNHTECHCVDRSSLTTFNSSPPRGKRSRLDSNANSNSNSNPHHQNQNSSEGDSNAICRCPRHYDILQEDERPAAETFGGPTAFVSVANGPPHVVLSSNINCVCDCLGKNGPCQRLKDGEEGFSIEDRNCIATRKCQKPRCRLGAYNVQTGRCPRLRNHKRAVRLYDHGYG